MAINYFEGERGNPGTLVAGTDSAGNAKKYVIPAVTLSDQTGAPAPVGGAADPYSMKSIGSAAIATSQAASSISPAAATSVVAARAGRQSVTFSNITGTQPVYFVATAVTTGVTTGFFLAGAVGASITIATAAAVFATSPTAAQTLSVLETF